MSVAENLKTIRERVDAACERAGRRPEEVTLIAVSKTKPLSMLQEAYGAGARDFGENKVQEILEKYPEMPEDARFHMIGHLQTNKVKQVVGKVDLIHSVDSERLLRAIDAQAAKQDLVQDILLEVNIAGEESKGGCTPEEARQLAQLTRELEHVRLRGLMAIPPISPEPGANRPFFAAMRQLFVDIKANMGDNQCNMDCLSMGMSGDYPDAIAEGATLVRVGTALFGPRPPMHKG